MHPRYYWISQFLGWGLYGVVGLVFQGMFAEIGWRNIALILSGCIILFSLTHYYRFVAKKKCWESLSFGRLVFRILGATFIMAVVSQLLVSALMIWVFDLLGDQNYSFVILGMYVFQNQILLICWSLIYFSFHAFRNRQIEQVERWRLQAAVNDAELTALKAQVNPHFIFNCLNNIRALVLENPEKSRDMITHLSDLLRYSIRLNEKPLVALEKEIEIVENYLKLESIHYEERLTYRISVDPAVLKQQVPPMSIQLLVENAIKHGISRLPEGGNIDIRARKEEPGIRVSVINTGQLVESDPSNPDSGIGLRNSQERLNLLFPSDCHLEIRNSDSNTVEASFSVPENPL